MSIIGSLWRLLELIEILLSHMGSVFGLACYVGWLDDMYRNHADNLWENPVFNTFFVFPVILNSCYIYIGNCHHKVIIRDIDTVNRCWYIIFIWIVPNGRDTLYFLPWIVPLYVILQLSILYLFGCSKDRIKKEVTTLITSDTNSRLTTQNEQIWDDKTMITKFTKFTNGCSIIGCIKDEVQTRLNIYDFISFYGLQRQIMCGDNNTSKPLCIHVVNRLKWKEWTKYKGMTKQQALLKWEELYNKYLRNYPNIFNKYTNSDLNHYDPFKSFITGNNKNLNELKSQLNIARAANAELRESVNTLKSELKSQNDELSARMNGMNAMNEEITRLKNENTEIQQKYDNLQVDHVKIVEEHKELEMNFKELELICNERLNKSEYYTWNTRDVVDWIVSLDKSRYNKYYDILLQNMKSEGINGNCLGDLERNDLHRLGMTQFTDKRDVYDAIQQLIANRQHIGNKPAEGLNDTAYLHK